MFTHNICFMEKYGKWSLNDLQIPTIFVPSRIHVQVRISPQVGLKPTTQWSKVARINHCTTMMLQTVKYSDIYKLMSRSNLPVKILPETCAFLLRSISLRISCNWSSETRSPIFCREKWDAIWQPTKWVCAQRRLRSGWASAQSDKSLRCPHEETLGSLATRWGHSEDSDQTGWMPRLIWVFAGCTLTLLVLSCRGSK